MTDAIPQENEHHLSTRKINIDTYTSYKINTIIKSISNKKELSQSDRISLISEKFLGTPCQHNTVYRTDDEEKLSIDFRGLNSFTYLDYIAALQTAHSQHDFLKKIENIRCADKNININNKNHFFTDWANRENKIAEDITAQVSNNTIKCSKVLNKKTNGEKYIPGAPISYREITYIPHSEINNELISRLESGDLIGIYSPHTGLDVSHVGLFIMTAQGPVFRHASSHKDDQSVVDSPFIPYLLKTPGIIVLRMMPSPM